MIRYTLRCTESHSFEMWFKDSATYDQLVAQALVSCPDCGSSEISKAIMAPSIAGTRKETTPTAPAPREIMQKIKAYREKVMAETTDVGSRFPQEARDMHEGIADPRPIRGQATAEEAKALQDEGIPVLPIPPEPPKEN